MTRRYLLLGALGSGLVGCGGSGNSDTVNPNIQVDWGYVPTRYYPPKTRISVPNGTLSVVITFEGASSKVEGGDVVLRGTRPGVQGTLSNGLEYYGSTFLAGGTDRIWRRETRIRIDCYQTLDGTGRLRQAFSTATPNINGQFQNLNDDFRVIRERIAGVLWDANGAQEITVPVGGTVPIKLTYTYPESVQETYSPDFSELLFQAAHGTGVLEEIVRVRELVSSPDEHGNPGLAVEGVGVGSLRLFVYVDGKQSNFLPITVVPAA